MNRNLNKISERKVHDMYEFLKKLFKEVDGQPEALTAEQLVERIQSTKGLNIVNLEDGGYVSKEKFDAKNTELQGVKQQLTDANATIQSYKDMDIDGIKKSAQEWETKYNTETKALNEKLAAQERAHQTDMFLSGYKYTSKAARAGVRAEFEKQNFKLVDGVYQGANDYMKKLMEDADYKGAFEVEDNGGKGGSGDGGNGGNGGNPTTGGSQGGNTPYFARGTNGGGNPSGGKNPFTSFGFAGVRPRPTEK